MRDHEPLVIDQFMGLFDRSSDESNKNNCPINHSLEALNLDFTNNEVRIRDGFGNTFEFTAGVPRRAWLFQNDSVTCFLIETTVGALYAMYVPPSAPSEVLLTVISPTEYYNIQMWDQRCYVVSSFRGYWSLGVPSIFSLFNGVSLVAAGPNSVSGPGAASIANSSSGVVQIGTRFFGVSYITNTGHITAPTPTSPASLVTPGNQLVAFSSIPVSGSSRVVARLLVGTRAIANPIPGATLADYQYYAIARISDNVTTTFNANFYDSQLINDMSWLSDQPASLHGAVQIAEYHKRLVLLGPGVSSVPGRPNRVLISRPFEPENFDMVTGDLSIDPVRFTNVALGPSSALQTGVIDAREFRDVLYITKLFSTYSLTDNGDEPIFWPQTIVDDSLGSFRNGINEILSDSGQSVLYLVIANKSGLYIFTGFFNRPELTWKVSNYWQNKLIGGLDILDITLRYSLLNDPFNKKIYFLVRNNSNYSILFADYTNVESNLSSYAENIKFSPWNVGTSPVGNFVNRVLNGKSVIYLTQTSGTTGRIISLGGTDQLVNEVVIATAILKSPEENLQHIAAVRANFHTTLSSSISDQQEFKIIDGLNSNREINLPQIDFEENDEITPTFITNFTAQRFQLYFRLIGNIQSNLIIRKFILFAKKIYNTLPFQFNK